MSAATSSDSEAVWIDALKRHDQEALAAVFERYSPRIYGLAVSLLHDEQQADGVVQNTFLALIENIEPFEEGSGGNPHLSTKRPASNGSALCRELQTASQQALATT